MAGGAEGGAAAPPYQPADGPLVTGKWDEARFSRTQFMKQLIQEFLTLLRQEKKWWLIPLVVLVLIVIALMLFSGGSVLAPVMYPAK